MTTQSESVPLVVIPGGYARAEAGVFPKFSSALNYRNVTKWAEQVTVAAALPDALRRAFTQAKNGRPGPTLVEVPVGPMPSPWEFIHMPRIRAAG